MSSPRPQRTLTTDSKPRARPCGLWSGQISMVGWVSNMVPMSPRHMYISYEVGNMRSRIQPLKKEGKEAEQVWEEKAPSTGI